MDDWMAERGSPQPTAPASTPVALDDALSLAAVPIPLLLVDSGGMIAFTNPGLDELFGYDPGVLAGQPVEVLIPPDVAVSHRELRDAYAFGGGLHCSTADVWREGACEDYFPQP